MTDVPPVDWDPPVELPDKLYGPVAVDEETKDDGLRDGAGAGWAWEDGGRVVGYAVAADNFKGYLPIAHEGGGNLDPRLVRRWINEVAVADPEQPKVAANAAYDLGWARRDGITWRGPTDDPLMAAALLDEHRYSYSLNAVAKFQLNEEKDEAILRRAAAAYGVDPKGELWKLPAPYVGPYAEADADLARRTFIKQRTQLEAEGLWDLYTMERDLIPLYNDMRWRGVRVDQDRVERARDRLRAEVKEIMDEVASRVGHPVDMWATATIVRAFDAEGLGYGRTPTGRPSITKALLEATDHWLARALLRAREKDKLAGTFLEGVILNNLHDGRVHGEIHPLRSDEGGTVTGRLSMSNPNLQFIPSRTEEGLEIRRCFLPEEGERWASVDVSQQEPRLLVHFASLVRRHGKPLTGALEARDRYLRDPDMSYHDFAAELTGLPYKRAKILNLAIIYGRGIGTTALELGLTQEETKRMFGRHHDELPFAKELAEVCQEVVRERGEIRSLLGRRVRFPFYEPARYDERDGRMFPRWQARKVWPGTRLQRARLHKSLNSLIQPSAADQIKRAMLDLHQDRPDLARRLMIQVHDELCCSVPDEATAREVADVIRDAVKLEVPVKVDVDLADNWGDCG